MLFTRFLKKIKEYFNAISTVEELRFKITIQEKIIERLEIINNYNYSIISKMEEREKISVKLLDNREKMIELQDEKFKMIINVLKNRKTRIVQCN